MNSFGTQIAVDVGGVATPTGIYTTFETAMELKYPGLKVGSTDTSFMLSTDMVKTSEPGWGEPGEASFKVKYNSADYATLYGLQNTVPRQNYPFRITLPDNRQILFPGHFSEIPLNVPGVKDEEIDIEIKVKQAGAATLA